MFRLDAMFRLDKVFRLDAMFRLEARFWVECNDAVRNFGLLLIGCRNYGQRLFK